MCGFASDGVDVKSPEEIGRDTDTKVFIACLILAISWRTYISNTLYPYAHVAGIPRMREASGRSL